MEFLKIIALCVISIVLYGILHDQVTARICIEYFTVFHPPIFATNSPTLLAIGWGTTATWWAGLIVGVPLALVSQSGRSSRIAARDLVRPVAILLAVMAVCALISGMIGFASGSLPYFMSVGIAPQLKNRLAADLWAHNASYFCGFVGGLVLCVLTLRRRTRLNRL